MAFADPRELPVFTLAELPPRTRHVVLTPALRWRAVVEEVAPIASDVILETVLRLRAAGESSPSRIADLLQLPDDLIRHLLAQATTANLDVTTDGQLRASKSEVAWVYRDLATGELWPDPAEEQTPVTLRFTSRFRARFDRGTAGKPVTVECLLLAAHQRHTAEPTSIELARFSTTKADTNRRAAVVSSGEECLVASPVVALATGHAVETTRGFPHLSLTQLLGKTSQQYVAVSKWLEAIPTTTQSRDLEQPLRTAVAELRTAHRDRVGALNAYEKEEILSRLELSLSRFVDQYQYTYGIDTADEPSPHDASALTATYGFDPMMAELLARSDPGTLPQKVARLLSAEPHQSLPAPQLFSALGLATAQWDLLARGKDTDVALTQLVHDTITLCERLLDASEELDVQQAG